MGKSFFSRRGVSLVTLVAMLASFISPLGNVSYAAPFVPTFTASEPQTGANPAKALVLVNVISLPVSGDNFTIGSCVVTFTTTTGSTFDETNCADNLATIDTNTGAGDIDRTPVEINNIIDTLTGVTDPVHGALTVSVGSATNTAFETTGPEISATDIAYADVGGKTSKDGWTTGNLGTQQIIKFVPTNPADTVVYKATMAGSTYLYTATGGTTAADVTAGFAASIPFSSGFTCIDQYSSTGAYSGSFICTQNAVGPSFGYAASLDTTPPVVGEYQSYTSYHPAAHPTWLVVPSGSTVTATITDADSAIANCERSSDSGATWLDVTGWTASGSDPKTGTCAMPTGAIPSGTTQIFDMALRGTDVVGKIGTGAVEKLVIDNIKPVSSADTGSNSQNTSTISVPYTATDADSDIKQVELFYRLNSGSWTSAGTGTTSPLSFDASTHGGVGTYDFYTLATDNVNNVESSTGKTIERTVAFNGSVPVVTRAGAASIYIVINTPYTDSGATWSDSTDGTGGVYDATFTLSGTVNTGSLGTYTLTYTKVNSLGNTGSTTRAVHVVNLSDLTSPILGAWTISPSFTTGSNIYHPSTNVTFSTTVVHNVTGIASCAIQVASTLYAGVFTPSTSTDGTCSYTFANVGAPLYSYAWIVTDNYGTTVTGATLSGPTPLGDFDTPISSASGNSAVYNATGIAIPFTATDTGIYQSGLDHLNLYMIHNNSGSWALAQTYNSGAITGGANLLSYTLANGFGTYYFYTVAVDNVGNTEVKTPSIEATFNNYNVPLPYTTVTSFPVVNNANKAAVTLAGICDNFQVNHVDDNVTLSIDDTDTGTTAVSGTIECNAWAWTGTVNLTSLSDGTLTATVTQTNLAGSTPGTNTGSTIKDTAVANVWSVHTFPASLNPSNVTNASFTGLVAGDPGATVNWKLTDSSGAVLSGTTTANMSEYSPGNYLFGVSGLDLSSLRDGAISFAGQVVDVAGNYTGEANGGSSAFGKDTIAPVVTISTVPPTSVDANAYIIEGTVTGGYTGVTIEGGSMPAAATLDGSGAFKAMVYLTQNNTNTITVSANDFAGNIGTGSVVITETTATDDYTGALDVTAADLQYVATVAGGDPTDTNAVDIQTPISFHPFGNIRVTLSAGTNITEASEGLNFDATALAAASTGVTSGLGTNEVSNGAIEFGISNVGLYFSKPVKVEIPVTGVTTATIPVKVKHGGTSVFSITGLTNSPTASCSNGRAYNGETITESNIATVSAGVATIYTCAASTFTTYSTVVPSNGGGGGYTPSIPGANAGFTGVILIPTGNSGGDITKYIAVVKVSELRKVRSKIVLFLTSLPRGTQMIVYRILPNGKKIKVGITRILPNGKIRYSFRQAGTYQFIQK